MGRNSWSTRLTVGRCQCIRIQDITNRQDVRSGLADLYANLGRNPLAICRALNQRVDLTIAGADPSAVGSYRVELTATPCNYGGVRLWFVCPLYIAGRPCRRRVGKLYLPPGRRYFGCRHCYNLTYISAQEGQKRHKSLLPPMPKSTGHGCRRWVSAGLVDRL